MATTIDFTRFMEGDALATQITNKYETWRSARSSWENDVAELRNYIFATDTRTTSNAQLDWKNSTTTPKLTQLRDSLHANYMAALFPRDRWLSWVGEDMDSVSKNTKNVIENFMVNRLNKSGFRRVVSELVYDFIDYGNAIAGVTYKDETVIKDNIITDNYVGPMAYRIDPHDIVFDITSPTFDDSPKITRTLKTIGEIKKDILHNAELDYSSDALDFVINKRKEFASLKPYERKKYAGLTIDGFGSVENYLSSGMVEILEFEGDIYDIETDTLLEDHIITIIDRTKIIRKEPREALAGKGFKKHVGWRLRPGNLMAMGPLDNLVGMQYRIDHLENLKADVFDYIAYPIVKVSGEVQDFNYAPGERIYTGEEGDVTFMHPDATALNADTQIQILEAKMEAFAGAPREAMGFRTPGEKTAFEVQQLGNAASRMFQSKIEYFEENFVEPLVNAMFELAKRNLQDTVTVEKIQDEDSSVISFIEINKKDIEASGKFYPRGARHFAAKAIAMQNLNTFMNSAVGQDEEVKIHFSGREIARLVDEILNFNQYDLFKDNARLFERAETAKLTQAIQKQLQVTDSVPQGEGDAEVPAA